MSKVKMICFDMDGTIADLYGVKNWLYKLRAEDPTPYDVAEPMWNMAELAEVLWALAEKDIEIRIVTWLSMHSSQQYKEQVRKAKISWLIRNGFPFSHFHGVQYGTTKADCVRRYLEEDEQAILIDDSQKVRDGWTLGATIDPTAENIIEILKNILKNA